MATNFLHAAGTHGFIVTPFALETTELNALGAGAAAVSSVGGSSGVFTQSHTANAQEAAIWFKSGGTFTPAAGQALLGWFLGYDSVNTAYETEVATPSTTVPALSRQPDFIIPLDNAAFASGNLRFASGANGVVPAPWTDFKVLIQNWGATALPASGNVIYCGPVAEQY